MILVDTNVWSELMRPAPDERVRGWESRTAPLLWLSTVVIGELLSGVELLPDGRKKSALRVGYADLLEAHADRIAAFDLEASRRYAWVVAQQIKAGRDPGTADSQIAATALARGMNLATRNTKHFEGLGLIVIDPWAA